MALGRHSQLILVIPKLDVVTVMTGVLRDKEHYPISELIDDIAGAVRSDKALQADPTAKALLANAIRQAAAEKPSAIEIQTWITFEGNKVTANFENTDGTTAELRGEASE
jgi:hypothetical protein